MHVTRTSSGGAAGDGASRVRNGRDTQEGNNYVCGVVAHAYGGAGAWAAISDRLRY